MKIQENMAGEQKVKESAAVKIENILIKPRFNKARWTQSQIWLTNTGKMKDKS